MIEGLLGFEFTHLTDEQLKTVTDRLIGRGLFDYRIAMHAGMVRWYVVLNFPEKGRKRFLNRHGQWLQQLKDELSFDYCTPAPEFNPTDKEADEIFAACKAMNDSKKASRETTPGFLNHHNELPVPAGVLSAMNKVLATPAGWDKIEGGETT